MYMESQLMHHKNVIHSSNSDKLNKKFVNLSLVY